MERTTSTASEITTLPTAMTAAACVGIAWYLCLELNIRLLVRSTRRSLYFWSCLLCSWAIIIHLVLILLLDFRISKNNGVLVVIHFTWWTYVVSQSVVLYSRLNLVVKSTLVASYVLYSIVFTAILFGLTTVILGLVARLSPLNPRLESANLIWDKVQLAAFFMQETSIGILYIRETALYLKNMRLLGTDRSVTRRALHHLIYVNIFIICLDCSLIGLCYAGYFFLQGFYKAMIYAIKLRTEFTILNQLRSTLPGQSNHGVEYGGAYAMSGNRQVSRIHGNAPAQGSQDSDVEMVVLADQIRVRKDVVVSTRVRDDRDSFGKTR